MVHGYENEDLGPADASWEYKMLNEVLLRFWSLYVHKCETCSADENTGAFALYKICSTVLHELYSKATLRNNSS